MLLIVDTDTVPHWHCIVPHPHLLLLMIVLAGPLRHLNRNVQEQMMLMQDAITAHHPHTPQTAIAHGTYTLTH